MNRVAKLCIFPMLLCVNHHLTAISQDTPPKSILDSIYKDLSGFGISSEESHFIESKGGSPTYGEITDKGVDTFLKDLHLTNHDVFYDLGCGEGKVCVIVALKAPVKKSVGVELSKSRVRDANTAQQRLRKTNHRDIANRLEFREEDIATTDLHDATIIFADSLCFSDKLMEKIASNIVINCKPGLYFITLKQLPTNNLFANRFKKDKDYTLETTWSSGSPAHRYQLLPEEKKHGIIKKKSQITETLK